MSKAAMAKAVKKKQKLRPDAEAATPVSIDLPKDRLDRLAGAIEAVRAGERVSPRTAKLLAMGVPKMAQKVVEEAAEVAIDAARGERASVVNESVDLLYNLVVLWFGLGIAPDEVWAEMDRREVLLGMAEKLPKAGDEAS